MSAPPPAVPIPPVPVKKTSPVVFILVGVGVFSMFIVMLVVAGTMYFAYKAKQFVENPARCHERNHHRRPHQKNRFHPSSFPHRQLAVPPNLQTVCHAKVKPGAGRKQESFKGSAPFSPSKSGKR